MTEEKKELFEKFPDDFNAEGVVELYKKQAEESHAMQGDLIKAVRQLIYTSAKGKIAGQFTLLRFAFNGYLDLLKKGNVIPLHVYLEIESIHIIVNELLERFPGKVSRLVMIQTADKLPRQEWKLVTEAKEFDIVHDCQIEFIKI